MSLGEQALPLEVVGGNSGEGSTERITESLEIRDDPFSDRISTFAGGRDLGFENAPRPDGDVLDDR